MMRWLRNSSLAAAFALCATLAHATVSLPWPGPGAATVGGSTAVLTYIGNANLVSVTATPTFTSQAIGTAAADRVVIVCAQSATNAVGAQTISGITIGGVSATQIIQNNTSISGFGFVAGCYYLLVTTGTTSTIIVTYSTAQSRGAIAVYNLNGTSGVGTAFSTNSAVNAGVTSTTVNTQSGGAILGWEAHGTVGGNSTWTGSTLGAPDVNTNPAGLPPAYSGVHGNSTTTATGTTIQVTTTVGSNAVMVVASW